MAEQNDYVRQEASGAICVGATRVMLDSILAAWAQGHSPETIRSQYPALSLELVYGAIAWSLAHPREVEQYLKEQDAVWKQWKQRSESQASPLRDTLRRAKLPAGTQ